MSLTKRQDYIWERSIMNLFIPIIQVIRISGSIQGVEVRGMFEFKGRFQHSTGGAFWSFHFTNPKSNQLICISGYVDAPSSTSWTHAIREIQAIWKSVTVL